MLKKRFTRSEPTVKVTFVLDGSDQRLPAFVAGDFNDWSCEVTPLKPRKNGTWSAVVTLPAKSRCAFRYRTLDGVWFNDDHADEYETNEHGSTNCIVLT